MEDRRAQSDRNKSRETPVGVPQEQVDAWVASLSLADRLALAADLAEADEPLRGTNVTGMSDEEFDRFLDRF